jgi:uncharacterized RDD family membrane protein YckC
METPQDPTSGSAQPAESFSTPPVSTPPAAPPAPAPPLAWEPPADLTAGPAPGYAFGGAGERLVAYIIDSLIVLVLCLVVFIVGLVLLAVSAVLAGIFWVVGFLAVIFVYFPYYWVKGGQTLGMKPFNLWVVRDSDGGPIGWGAAILRLLGLYVVDSIIFGIPIGLIWVFFDKRKRCWHDLIAGTVVVKRV